MKKLNKIFKYILFLLPLVSYCQDTPLKTLPVEPARDQIDTANTDVINSNTVMSSPVEIDYNFIDSYPQNAGVYVNDETIGNTPLFFVWKDSTFPKMLKISLNGFSDQTEIIENDLLLNKIYILKPSGNISPADPVKENMQTYFKKPLKVVPIVITSVVTAGSGIAAFYFKSLASENRKDYEISGDHSLLDKERKYNVLGSVSLAVLQLGFGALLYYLFFN